MGPQGIFGAYWNRFGGKINVTYGMAGYQTGSWFQVPVKTRQPVYQEPISSTVR
jgi:hypothetical protein